MKKLFKIIFLLIGLFTITILLDTLQALLLNNDPIIGVYSKCRTKEGLFVETYHCESGINVTKFKKNTCYIDDVCNTEDIKDKELAFKIKDNLNKIAEAGNMASSNPYDYTTNEYYTNIVNLGHEAVPVLNKMYKRGELTGLNAYISALAIQDITKCNLYDEYKLIWSTADEFYKLWETNNCGFNNN